MSAVSLGRSSKSLFYVPLRRRIAALEPGLWLVVADFFPAMICATSARSGAVHRPKIIL
jgi:hypothetical protein